MARNPSLRLVDPDAQFFVDHPDRFAHIRKPRMVRYKTPQRGVQIDHECVGEFWALGEHSRERRWIILYRVPKDNPMYNPADPQILKIPFLAFSDETIEDRDDVLLPIIDTEMRKALERLK